MNPAKIALTCPQPVHAPRLRLVCFPYAGGGGHVFHDWARLFPPEIEIHLAHYPGRGGRLREPLSRSFAELVGEMHAAAADLAGKGPLALFGHSLGAILAYEVARRLTTDGKRPTKLIVSATAAPQRRHSRTAIHHLPEPEFLEELKRMGGMDPAILANQELLQLVLPIIRSDLALADDYVCPTDPTINVNLIALAGTHDDGVSTDDVRAWAEITTGSFEYVEFPGDHLFIRGQLRQVGEQLKARLCRP